MIGLIATIVVVGGCLMALHMVLTYRAGGFAAQASGLYSKCACGHAAAFHKDAGGCRHTHDGSTDCYGYCTCARTRAEVEGVTLVSVRSGT